MRTKLALDAYLQEKDYPYEALVAFSGTVTDPDNDLDFTETRMNTASSGQHIPEAATQEAFKDDRFRFLVVANKFQTGFDQPLLAAMYVDKKLGGVNAVQTLSRLNRIYPGKEDPLVLDFVNEAEEIRDAFAPYYERTLLSEETDPNVLYNLQENLLDHHFYTNEEVDEFNKMRLDGRINQGSLHAFLESTVLHNYREADQEEQIAFRGQLNQFLRLYGFLAQILPFLETEWEKLFHYGRLLLPKLSIDREGLPLEVLEAIDIDTYSLQQTYEGEIELARGTGRLKPVSGEGVGQLAPQDMEPLSEIIAELNRIFGIEVDDDAKAAIQQLQTKLGSDPGLDASVRVNTPENARLTFDQIARDLFGELIESNFQFYKQVTDDTAVQKRFFDWLFEQYLKRT